MTDAIEIRGLNKCFSVDGREVVVLQNMELSLPADGITVLLGRSGCGKTTLLRLIGGLDRDYSGEITLPGNSKIAFVFQEARLMPWLTVRQNVAFGLKKRELDQAEIRRLLEMTGLEAFAGAYPRQLSGGMQQRTALARALAMHPGFILMDEPFAALDHFTRERMQQALLTLHRNSRCGILFVTHSIEEAFAIADRIVILEDYRAKKGFPLGEEWRKNATDQQRRLLREEILSSIDFNERKGETT